MILKSMTFDKFVSLKSKRIYQFKKKNYSNLIMIFTLKK